MDWKEEYAVLPEIDREHRVLVDCVSEIEQAGDAQGQRAALAKLVYQTRSHFTLEETLMRIIGYADVEPHVREHKQFLANLKTVEQQGLTGSLSSESVAKIRDWLEEHLRADDRQYAAMLTAGNREFVRNYYRHPPTSQKEER